MDRQSVEISSDDDLMMMMIYYRFNYCRAFAPDPYRCVRNILVHSGSSSVFATGPPSIFVAYNVL